MLPNFCRDLGILPNCIVLTVYTQVWLERDLCDVNFSYDRGFGVSRQCFTLQKPCLSYKIHSKYMIKLVEIQYLRTFELMVQILPKFSTMKSHISLIWIENCSIFELLSHCFPISIEKGSIHGLSRKNMIWLHLWPVLNR